MKDQATEQINANWHTIDTNGDGFCDKEEARVFAIKEMGGDDKHPGIEAKIAELMVMDTNQDGKVSKDEMLAFAHRQIDIQIGAMMA